MQTDNKIFIPDLTPHLEKIRLENQEDRNREELLKLMAPAKPFPEKEMTEAKRKERLEKSNNDFWFFDKTYFPKEYYPDYAPAGKFHQELISIADLKDKKAHIISGSRSVAKTSMFKKKFIYDFLHGKRRNMAAASETLDPPSNFLLDIIYFLETNERIKYDYKIDWYEKSSEKLFAKSELNLNGTFVDILSIERSSKGRSRGLFLRYDLIFLTDWENRTSSLTTEAVEKRILRLNEMRTSLADDGVMIAEGNNFDPDCAQNHLLLEQEKGILSPEFVLHIYPAWDDKRKWNAKSLWPQKYPAKTEDELKALMKPKDDYDWSGDFQQHPIKKSGNIFPDTFYAEWDMLPKDIKSVTFTDPNCALKAKGDTTAITALGFSPSQQKFFISRARCKSYDNSNDLLTDLLMMLKEWKPFAHIIDNAFDGNVAQESTWENNIRNFTRVHQFPYPAITFKRYKIDDLAAPVEAEWKQNKFLFPTGFSKTEEGKRYLKQLFGFSTKKAKKKDDAPDSLISAYTFLVEKGIAHIGANSGTEFISVSQRQIHKI
jgi:hypothetical protein